MRAGRGRAGRGRAGRGHAGRGHAGRGRAGRGCLASCETLPVCRAEPARPASRANWSEARIGCAHRTVRRRECAREHRSSCGRPDRRRGPARRPAAPVGSLLPLSRALPPAPTTRISVPPCGESSCVRCSVGWPSGPSPQESRVAGSLREASRLARQFERPWRMTPDGCVAQRAVHADSPALHGKDGTRTPTSRRLVHAACGSLQVRTSPRCGVDPGGMRWPGLAARSTGTSLDPLEPTG